MTKRFLFWGILFFFVQLTYSQAQIEFDKRTFDFGNIDEGDGRVTHNFIFKNTGSTPLIINDIQTSCGCTSPTWTRTPVAPGKSGIIAVSFNPLGRPGQFTKAIYVHSNALDIQENLTISGNVIPRPNQELEEKQNFPFAIDDLLLSAKTLELNDVNKGDKVSTVIKVKNKSNGDVKLSLVPKIDYISFSPQTVPADSTVDLIFLFDSDKCPIWGVIKEEINLSINKQRDFSDDSKIIISGNIIEDFTKLSPEELAQAPVLKLSVKSVDLGTIGVNTMKINKKRTAKFRFTNAGRNRLEIRRIINSNSELTVKNSNLKIKSGKSQELKIELNTTDLLPGIYKKTITVQTNAPENTFVVLELNWEITP